jgi:S-adenosylmethionine-diacylglycerol 3-amino-3-carboxypropyl transferase
MEDPRIDMRLFDLHPKSNIFVLASGGCNALHYALDANVESVHCVDANPCQIALLNLKKQVIEHGSHQDLWKMFGVGKHETLDSSYAQNFRPGLPTACATFWDKNIKNFQGSESNLGFHYHTGCGFMTRCFRLLKEDHLVQIGRLFELSDKNEQIAVYEKYLEPVFNGIFSTLLISFSTQFGIPSRQLGMISQKSSEVIKFLNARIKYTLTELPAKENYFYHLYMFGNYRRDCAPEYLKEDNFQLLKNAHRKISVTNAYVADYLSRTQQCFSHFALLDHLDWLVHNPALLEDQWRAILSRSQPGAKLIIRSYFSGFEWLPDFAKKHVDIATNIDAHISTDRLGIYNKTHLIFVK